MPEHFLEQKLQERRKQNAFRTLKHAGNTVDFCSNDYLGIIKNGLLSPKLKKGWKHGSGGSRLLSGNYSLIEATENDVAVFHQAQAGLIFNSGYDANIALLSCVPQKGDTIVYDSLSHASLRDGIRLSFARSFSFAHNNVADLQKRLAVCTGNIFIVTESIFSMDGDTPPLAEIFALAETFNAHVIIDEAHATGIAGEKGAGVVQLLNLQDKCFARVHTFGKACGAHGAIVLGSVLLKDFLINFARPFIYTTALPESSIAAIRASYDVFPFLNKERAHLQALITEFKRLTSHHHSLIINGQKSPIQVIVVPGNNEAKKLAEKLQTHDLDVRAILYPTVPAGRERLRIVLHAFNTPEQVKELSGILNSST